MPVYEYRCKACGKTHEIEHGFHDERPSACPACGGQLVRVFHPVGVVFKGSGFHKTDYSRSGARAGADAATPGSKPGEPSGDKKSEPKTADSKTASESGAAAAKSSGDSKSSSVKSSDPAKSGGPSGS